MDIRASNSRINTHYAASKLCRACLSDHEDMQDIFQTCFSEVFIYCTSVQISENDGLPSALCRNCVSLLNTLYYFKQQCIRSDETLKQIITPQVTGNIKEEDALIDMKYDLKYDINVQSAIRSNFELDDDNSTLGDHFVCDDNGEFYDQKSLGCDLSNLAVDSLVDITATNSIDPHIQETPTESSKCSEECEEMPIEENIGCEACSEVFCNAILLKKHVKEKHLKDNDSKREKTKPSRDELLTAKNKTQKKTLFKCPKCEKQFKMSHRLDAHIREHYGLKGNQITTKYYLNFSTPSCKSFRKTHTTRHIQKPFDCQICQKEFSNWRTLKMHMNRHTGQKKYICDVCKKAFAYPTVLEIHKKIHLGIKKYSCTICNASFVQSGQLKSHMSTHSSEQPFSCSECNKRFKSSSILKSHMERHKGVKNFVCSICGKRFPTNGELTIHMRSHNNTRPFQCSHCIKAFKSNSLLAIHNRTHSGDRPYKCQVCPKQFMDSQVLKRHTSVHEDMKPHVCGLCHRGFGQKYSLKKHMKSHEQILQGICFEFIDKTRE